MGATFEEVRSGQGVFLPEQVGFWGLLLTKKRSGWEVKRSASSLCFFLVLPSTRYFCLSLLVAVLARFVRLRFL
jgi:hypothetical protein